MRKRMMVLLAACLVWVLAAVPTAYAGDLDYIRNYDITIAPNTEDGSLDMTVHLRWEVLAEGPVEWVKIGIPNGSIRDVKALTDNIASLDFDNSYMYVYFDRGYDDGEIIEFSYRWTQEYMYTLDGSAVAYDYATGWFDEALIESMTVTWTHPQGVAGTNTLVVPPTFEETQNGNVVQWTGHDLTYGAKLDLVMRYEDWPTELLWENSKDNMPVVEYEPDYSGRIISQMTLVVFVVMLVIFITVFSRAARSYRGGFGTHYVFYHGLWYPAGRDGKPRPGSTGTKTKPKTSGGGFGGGRGGFGGGGFGGGGHCACASSCACACACACAGGGRAGCSAKNLYGAVNLSKSLTDELRKERT